MTASARPTSEASEDVRVCPERNQLRRVTLKPNRSPAPLDMDVNVLGALDLLVRSEHHDDALRRIGRDIDPDEVTRRIEEETRWKISVERGSCCVGDDDHGRGCRVVGVAGGVLLGEHDEHRRQPMRPAP